ncbi:MAG: hypothetical protein J0I21_01145 [Alphaproteobacteria bacterium]|nr:hypothetical protein [Alphaproteobacteria bacterium]
MRLDCVALVMGALLLGACTTEQELVNDRESLLSAAGFAFRPANTPERMQQLANLPPRQFTYQERNGKIVYLFGDAQYCKCLYIGSEQNYQAYQQMVFQRRLAQQNMQAAQMMSMNAWDWGPWGPGFWY